MKCYDYSVGMNDGVSDRSSRLLAVPDLRAARVLLLQWAQEGGLVVCLRMLDEALRQVEERTPSMGGDMWEIYAAVADADAATITSDQ